VRVVTSQGLLTAGTGACPVRLQVLCGGLAGQARRTHLLGEDRAQFEEEVVDRGELGTPGGTIGAVTLLDEVVGDALDVGAYCFDLGGALLGLRHPRTLSACATKMEVRLTRSVENLASPVANHVVRPKVNRPPALSLLGIRRADRIKGEVSEVRTHAGVGTVEENS
jgi:hypothetical protein